MIGRTVSHYQILDKLGEGGMGVVYKARDAHLDRFVAIKVLPAHSVADENRRRRFVQEAKAASALNHPNIVHIYDIDRADGLDYIAMEYVQGRTLDLLIGRKGLKLPEALSCSIQITDALAKAHGAGIVHRDLKPSNVMVTPDGLVKVLDFGLAKLTQNEPAEDDATQTLKPATEEGTIVGTVAYMSPEQAEGKPVDARSDIFSFGSVFYEMLTGQRAFRGETKVSTLAAILLKDPKPASEISAGLPAEVERVLSRCLRKDPARRFQHMDDIKVALSDLKEESAPRRGYRFMAPVSTREAGPGERRPRHAKLVVLPFANLSGDPAQEYFSDGMTEELITELACVAPERLGVIARTSAMRYKGSRKELARIGRELDVGYIVEGSVRRSGDRVRVSAQLIRVDDQTHVWAQSYDGELRDALTLQSEIARAITQHVDVNLAPGADRRIWRAQPLNPEAYHAYLLGLQQYSRGSPCGFEKADEYFRLAAERHPGFALAYAKAALAYALSAYFGYVPQAEAYPKAEAAARRALEIDNSLTEAHNALAIVHWFHHWNLTECDREYEFAVRLNPNDPAAHWGMAMFLGSMKEDHRGAAIEAGLALSLDPLSILIRSTVCWLPYWARSYDQAIAQARTTLELEENSLQALYVIGVAARAKGVFDESIAALEQSAAKFADPLSLAHLGMTYGLAGRGDQARAVLRRLEKCCAPRNVPCIFPAFVYVGLGENRMALDHIEMAFDERDAIVLWLRVSPDWDLLRGEPRFQQLLARLDLPRRLTT